tara:strand:+ start:3658 stop:6933 length:3276 start_codon:yes stop_codon:yes gene_type:complete
MSLITIRDARDIAKYRQITVTVTEANTTAKTLKCTNNSAFRTLAVGMRILDLNSPGDGTTSNQIVSISADVLTMESNVDFATGSITFTTANVKEVPLTNLEVDDNFLALEKNKLDAIGNQIIEGNVEIRDSDDTTNPGFATDSSGNLFVSNKIIASSIDIGGSGGTATLTTTGDVEAEGLRLNGEFDDRVLFEKYSITSFDQHLLCEFSGDDNKFLGYSVLFLDKVTGLTVGQSIEFNLKTCTIKEIFNGDEKFIYVEDNSTTFDQNYAVGSTATISNVTYTLKKFLRVEDYLKPNQLIKIFGSGEANIAVPATAGLSKDTSISEPSDGTTYSYKALQLNRKTGKISIADGSASSVDVKNVNLNAFDETTFNRLNITRNASTGNDLTDLSVLLYRKSGSAESEHSLVAIIDDSLFSTSSAIFNDYGNFIINAWSGRKTTDGKYTDVNLEYIPKTYEARTSAGNDYLYNYGYHYVRVNTITSNDNTFTVKSATPNGTLACRGDGLNSPGVEFNALRLFHNNSVTYDDAGNLTGGLQKLINDRKATGRDVVTLLAGTYHTSVFSLPSNITLKGESRFNTILKLPPLDNSSDSRSARTNASINDILQESLRNYDNTILGLTKSSADTEKHNISVEDLTIDGNFINRFNSNDSELASIIADNLVRAENINQCLFRGLIIKNSVGGGVYAPATKNLSFENNSVIDNCQVIKDTDFFSPFYGLASQDINLFSNKLINANSPVDLSNVIRGSLVGNIVKNTDTGVITYGSVNFVTTPNLILGPNNEFLGTTDTLDSEFDSINVDLFQHTGAYTSPDITFLKEGLASYLAEDEQVDANGTVIPGSGVQLTSKIHVLAKQNQFEYFIDDLIPLNITTNSVTTNISETAIGFPATAKNLGQLKFTLVQDRITELKNNFSMVGARFSSTAAADGLYIPINLQSKFDRLPGVQPANQTLVGLAYQINAVEYEGLTNTNDHVKFIKAISSGNNIKITLNSTANLSDFIIDREVILSANTTSNSGGQFDFINVIADNILPSAYKVCKVTGINTDSSTGAKTVTLTRTDTTLTGVASFNIDLQATTDNYLVGFKNTFLIAKGRILV